MCNLKRIGAIIAFGAIVVACGKGTNSLNPNSEAGLIPAATEHTSETPTTETEPAVRPDPAVIANPEPVTVTEPAVVEVHAVTVSDALGLQFMNISREYKAEESCIQMLGGLKANSAQLQFANSACPASGAIAAANIAFELKADIEALPATSEKEVAQSQIRKGFLTFKGMPMSEPVPVEEEQGQMKKALPITEAIEQRVGEFEIRSWTELVPVQAKPAMQEERKTEEVEKGERSVLRHEIVLTKLCTDEYAASCQVVFQRGHFSSIQLLATEVVKEEVKEQRPAEEVVEEVKEQRPAEEVKVEEVKEQRPAEEVKAEPVKEQRPEQMQG